MNHSAGTRYFILVFQHNKKTQLQDKWHLKKKIKKRKITFIIPFAFLTNFVERTNECWVSNNEKWTESNVTEIFFDNKQNLRGFEVKSLWQQIIQNEKQLQTLFWLTYFPILLPVAPGKWELV